MDSEPRTVDPAYAFIGAFVEELARGGLAHVCVCPGSRSTPLALSFAQESRIRLWMHLDERSAAFFALGLARATRTPVALVCTSGTAVANFMPAVVEARQARVPLIVLTADRPPELRDAGAPQTIDQIRFYGSQAKWAVEMPLPEATDTLLRFARTAAARALSEAGEVAAGPVHLNFPLREPLVPTPSALPSVSESARHGRADDRPYATTTPGVPLLSAPQLAALAERLEGEAHGLIVAGPMDEPGLAAPLAALARATGYPILADPLSGLRCGPHDRALVVDAYDAFLRDAAFAAGSPARLILRFGAMPTAKPLLQYLQRHQEAETIVVDPAGWRDPTLLAARMVRADPAALCTALLAHLDSNDQPARDDRWAERWVDANRRSREALAAGLAAIEEPFEPRAIAELAALLPAGATLFAGNSMPVRDIDTFFGGGERTIRIIGNRGASGIDGVVSTALGMAAAGGGPVVLVDRRRLSLPRHERAARRPPAWPRPDDRAAEQRWRRYLLLPAAGRPEERRRCGRWRQLRAAVGDPARPRLPPRRRPLRCHLHPVGYLARLSAGRGARHRGRWPAHRGGADRSRTERSSASPAVACRLVSYRRPTMMVTPIGTRRMRLSVDGLAYNVTIAGVAGLSLLLLHGFTGSGATWLSLLAPLAAHHRVVAVDLPGHGRTDAPEDSSRYGIDRTVRDLLALMDQLEAPAPAQGAALAPAGGDPRERWAVLGYSMGGRLALHLALAAPDRVVALVLEGASPGIADPEERRLRREADDALAARIEREGVAAFVGYWESLPLFASQQRLPKSTRAALRAARLANAPYGLANSLRGAGTGTQQDLRDRLATLPMPVLLIAGEWDEKYRQLAGEMAGRIPCAEVAIIAGAGHAAHLEQPERFAATVAEFLEREEKGGTP